MSSAYYPDKAILKKLCMLLAKLAQESEAFRISVLTSIPMHRFNISKIVSVISILHNDTMCSCHIFVFFFYSLEQFVKNITRSELVVVIYKIIHNEL